MRAHGWAVVFEAELKSAGTSPPDPQPPATQAPSHSGSPKPTQGGSVKPSPALTYPWVQWAPLRGGLTCAPCPRSWSGLRRCPPPPLGVEMLTAPPLLGSSVHPSGTGGRVCPCEHRTRLRMRPCGMHAHGWAVGCRVQCTQANPSQPKSTHANQGPPKATQDHPRPPKATPRPPKATQGHPRPPKATQGHPRPPKVTQGHPRPPEATQGHPNPTQGQHKPAQASSSPAGLS